MSFKSCPFCGNPPRTDVRLNGAFASCSNMECWLRNVWMPILEWNTRPWEDKLEVDLDKACSTIVELKNELSVAEKEINAPGTIVQRIRALKEYVNKEISDLIEENLDLKADLDKYTDGAV